MPSLAVVAASAEWLQVGSVVCATSFQWLDMVNAGCWPLASSAQWFLPEDSHADLLPCPAITSAVWAWPICSSTLCWSWVMLLWFPGHYAAPIVRWHSAGLPSPLA